MTEIKFEDMVKTLVKPGVKLVEEMTPSKINALHMAVGVAGEGGELLDAVKKHVIYDKPIDKENVIEELGDLEFYMEGLRQEFNITRDQTLKHNIEKLGTRYKKFIYSNEAAQDRADKKVG